jgi:hypothetical protein
VRHLVGHLDVTLEHSEAVLAVRRHILVGFLVACLVSEAIVVNAGKLGQGRCNFDRRLELWLSKVVSVRLSAVEVSHGRLGLSPEVGEILLRLTAILISLEELSLFFLLFGLRQGVR